MKKLEKFYITSVIITIFFNVAIIVYMYVNSLLDTIINPYFKDVLVIIGIVLILYSSIFSAIYIVKVIASFLIRKEKYTKQEKIKDFKLIIGTIISTSIIFLLFYQHVVVINGPPLGKPVIYLYPQVQMQVQVKLNNVQKLTHTYPKYIDGWNVIASPSGNLLDTNTGRNLYCLYWEGRDDSKIDMSEGFVIPGKDTISFLEEKLSILGLSEREANEFIIYWLPIMENNKYNYIRFRTSTEINNYMQLDISPKPDIVIRVIMDFKPLDVYVLTKQQKLDTPHRSGFVVVEWGARQLQ